MSLIEVTHLHRQALDRVARVNLTQDTTYNHYGTMPDHVFKELAAAQLVMVLDGNTSALTGLGAQTLKRWYVAGDMGIKHEPEDYTLQQLDSYAQKWTAIKAVVTAQHKAREEN